MMMMMIMMIIIIIPAFYGKYNSATDEVRSEKPWKWLSQSVLKKETTWVIMVTQEQVLRTTSRK